MKYNIFYKKFQFKMLVSAEFLVMVFDGTRNMHGNVENAKKIKNKTEIITKTRKTITMSRSRSLQRSKHNAIILYKR